MKIYYILVLVKLFSVKETIHILLMRLIPDDSSLTIQKVVLRLRYDYQGWLVTDIRSSLTDCNSNTSRITYNGSQPCPVMDNMSSVIRDGCNEMTRQRWEHSSVTGLNYYPSQIMLSVKGDSYEPSWITKNSIFWNFQIISHWDISYMKVVDLNEICNFKTDNIWTWDSLHVWIFYKWWDLFWKMWF